MSPNPRTPIPRLPFDDAPVVPDLPDAADRAALEPAIEEAVREQLQVRIAVTVLAHGALPRGAYKNPLVVTRDSLLKGSTP